MGHGAANQGWDGAGGSKWAANQAWAGAASGAASQRQPKAAAGQLVLAGTAAHSTVHASAAAAETVRHGSAAHLDPMALHQLVKPALVVRIIERVCHAVAAPRLHAQPQILLGEAGWQAWEGEEGTGAKGLQAAPSLAVAKHGHGACSAAWEPPLQLVGGGGLQLGCSPITLQSSPHRHPPRPPCLVWTAGCVSAPPPHR